MSTIDCEIPVVSYWKNPFISQSVIELAEQINTEKIKLEKWIPCFHKNCTKIHCSFRHKNDLNIRVCKNVANCTMDRRCFFMHPLTEDNVRCVKNLINEELNFKGEIGEYSIEEHEEKDDDNKNGNVSIIDKELIDITSISGIEKVLLKNSKRYGQQTENTKPFPKDLRPPSYLHGCLTVDYKKDENIEEKGLAAFWLKNVDTELQWQSKSFPSNANIVIDSYGLFTIHDKLLPFTGHGSFFTTCKKDELFLTMKRSFSAKDGIIHYINTCIMVV